MTNIPQSANPPDGWQEVSFDRCVTRNGVRRKGSIQQSEYRSHGKYPVVDQGEGLIAAYSDADSLVHSEALPLIVFGDHTRAFKFVNFPFITGADGTQLLLPNEEEVDPRFLYYALRNLDIPSRGYSRHFKYLKEQSLWAPKQKDEQHKIAAILWKIESAAEIQERIVAKLTEFNAATMARVFREGLRDEPLKQTEIGEIPESWDVKRIDSITHPVSGGTPSKRRAEWWKGSLPWASPKDMKRLRLRDTEDHITLEAAEEGSRLVPVSTIFVVIRGMILARNIPVAIADVPMAFNQDMKALLPTGAVESEYLLYALCFRREALIPEIGRSAHGTRRIGTASVESLLVPVPRDPEEQREIADVFNALDKREDTAKQKLATLRDLFSSLLDLLMSGRLRVNQLDLAEVTDG